MLKRILYTLLSVLLLSLPWLGGSALTLFVAFVPLLWVEHSLAGQTGRRGKPRRFWPYVVSAFVLWWLATVWWVGYAAVIGVVAATVVGATQMSVVFLVYHAVLRRARRALACTVLVSGWIAYETLFINGEISFPWLVLGNAFAQDVRLVQWYEWTGALGGSLWVLVTNLLVFEAIRRPRGWRGWAAPALAFVVPAAVSLTMYATYREPERTVRVTVVQPNIDPYYEKFVLKQAEQRGILLSLMAQAPEDVDFIVAPETAIDEDFWEKSIGRAPAIAQFRDFVRERYPSALVVTGANTLRRYPSEREASPTARCNRDSTLWYDDFQQRAGDRLVGADRHSSQGEARDRGRNDALLLGSEKAQIPDGGSRRHFGTARHGLGPPGLRVAPGRLGRARDLLRGDLRGVLYRVRPARGRADVRHIE